MTFIDFCANGSCSNPVGGNETHCSEHGGYSDLKLTPEEFIKRYIEPLCKKAVSELKAGRPGYFNQLVNDLGFDPRNITSSTPEPPAKPQTPPK